MGVRMWTKRQEDLLRLHCRDWDLARLAEAVGKPVTAVRGKISALGLSRTGKRHWKPWEDDFLRLVYPEHSAKQIGKSIGRGVSSVYQRANHLGLAEHRSAETLAAVDTSIRENHPKGWSDSEIAAVAGCSREWVSERRRRLGLPANDRSEHYRDRVRRKTREQLDAAGVASLADLQKKVWRERAIAAGWPENLRFRQVQILNALWDRGPMTRREIAAAIGMRADYSGPHGQRHILRSNDPEGSYVAHLLARGLIVVLKRARPVTGQGKGRSQDVYMLAFDIKRGPVSQLHQPSSGDAA